MNRAYSLFEIRSADEEKRIIEGVATTPKVARDGDILETKGIRYQLPIPFLYQHNSKTPMGNVVEARVMDDGIHVRIQIAPQGTADFIDEAWRLIRAGVVRGLSIGWRTLKETFDKSFGGFRISESEWLELSAVPVPADTSATIVSVRTADSEILAALGIKESASTSRRNPSLTGVPVQLTRQKTMTVKEQIAGLEAKRSANDAAMQAIMTKAADENRTRTVEELETYRDLSAQVDSIDADLEDYRKQEKRMVTTAKPVAKPEETATATERQAAATSRSGGHPVIQVQSMQPKGIGVARMAICMMNSLLTHQNPIDVAKRRYPDSPDVESLVRATIEAGDTTTSGWASQLVPSAIQQADEFRGIYRANTIIGRITGIRRVPFNIAVPVETASGTAAWVGEGAPKPVTKLTLTSVSLTWAKAAAIVGITDELARFSTPSAEMVVRDSMTATLTRFFDSHFVSTTAAVSNVSPAGILSGISGSPITASSTTAAAFRTDMNNMLNNFTANNIPLSNIVILMSSTTAVALSLMVTDLGVQLFPSITRDGGTVLGFPVIVSEAVGTKIIGLNVSDLLLAEDPGVRVDVSREASIEMSDTPILGDTSPTTSAVIKSAFQNNLIFVRVEQYITWKLARSTGAEYITSVAYVP